MISSGLRKLVQRLVFGVLCVGVIISGASYQVQANGKVVIVQSVVKGDNICLFMKGLGEYSNVTGQIGREPVEIVNSSFHISGHTIIMIDNSLSVTKDNLVKAKEVLKRYLENKGEDEKVSLAIYGTDIQYLVEKEADGGKIVDALESIVSEDKDTYLTDVLYDELQKLENKAEYTKFIVVTDGVDNKEIGYTKEELTEYLKDHSYPVYALGCKYKSNEEQLKSLFALSRATNAEYYLLDDYEEYSEIEEGLCEPIACVEVKIPQELQDGSTKNVLLSFECADGTVEVSDELTMPFGVKTEEEPTPEPTKISAPEETPVIETEPVVTPEPAEEVDVTENAIDLVSIGAIIVAVIAFIVLLIINIRKKIKKKDKAEKKEVIIPPTEEVDSATVMVESVSDEEATVFLESRDSSGYIVVLHDSNDAGRVFRYPLVGKVIIGRKYGDGVNIVLNYDPAISAKHCEVSKRGDKFFIRDLHSSNGTFVNGQRVEGDMEFTSGNSIKLGNLCMTITIEQNR